MKKRLILLPLVLLLASCGESNDAEWRKSVYEQLSFIATPTVTKYTPTVEGHISDLSSWLDLGSDYDVPDGLSTGEDSYYFGNDPVFHLPIHITQENFCKSDFTETQAGYAFDTLKEILLYNADPVTTMKFEKYDDGFSFYSEGISKYLTFFNSYAKDGPDIYEMSAYGRYNIKGEYNAQGLLTKVTCKTVTQKDEHSSVDVTLSISYQA